MEIKLSEQSTRAPKHFDKDETKQKTAEILRNLSKLQNVFYADGTKSLLIVLQGMDASGKDGLIKNVFTSMNPQGVSVTSFKAPDVKELAHDFLWRIHLNAPGRGMIKIFNRSHYEDVLITRVHGWIDDDLARKRMKAINDFEEMLTRHNNTTILKFYLHISKEEQQERLTERLNVPEKKWKYNANDFNEAALWDKYMQVYQDCFRHCDVIPWTIVPSDQNWFKEYTIAKAVEDSMTAMDLKYPGIT